MCAETESPNQTGGRTVTMATQSLATAAEISAEWKGYGSARESKEGRPAIHGHALIGEHVGIASSTRPRLEERSASPPTPILATRTV